MEAWWWTDWVGSGNLAGLVPLAEHRGNDLVKPQASARRPMTVNRHLGLSVLTFLLAVVAACAGSADRRPGTAFTSPQPGAEGASGLTIDFVPDGYSWVWNEGHETAVFHVFQTEDGSGQVSVGVQISPSPHPGSGETVIRDGRDFVVYDEGPQMRVTEDVGNDTRVDVVSGSLDRETLLRIAESTTYQPVEG